MSNILGSAAQGEPLRVVADQHGNPTYAPHLANAILEVARQLTQCPSESATRWGIYHAAGAGITSWHGLACEILESAAKRGREMASLEPISTADYPTLAPRPLNSSLDCTRFERAFGLVLPSWQDGVDVCIARLLSA